MKKLLQFTLFTIFLGCSSENESKPLTTSLDTFKTLHIDKYVEHELTTSSSDISPCCCVSISETLFPNKEKYPLGTPMEFFTVENSGFYLSKGYFYSTSDSIVRAILYDWEFPRHRLTFSEKLFPRKNLSKKLYKKYNSIILDLKRQLGSPSSTEIVDEDYYRESHLWNSEGQSKAYVFILGDKDKEFYRLRLVTYE